MLLEGTGERCLLSKDEPLTTDIDGVTALRFSRNRAKNTKIGQKLANIGPLDPGFYLFLPRPPGGNPFKPSYPRTTEPSALGEKLRYTGEHEQGVK